jgi:hypothetical protein
MFWSRGALAELVAAQKNYLNRVVDIMVALVVSDYLTGPLHQCEPVATTKPEQCDIEVEIGPKLVAETADQRAVALFALTCATQKYGSALRPSDSPTSHPR